MTNEISKQLVTMEDLAQGVGKVSQSRGNNTYELGKVAVPYSVETEDELKAIDVSNFSLAKVYYTSGTVEYTYEPFATSGIASDHDDGYWVVVTAVDTTVSSSSLQDKDNNINVYGKVVGARVFDSTLGRPLWATATSPTAEWVGADGATVHTPS